MRFITPIILLVISIASFLMFTNPTYTEIKALKVQAASYNDALNNAAQLQADRDTLTAEYNAFTPDQLTRLSELLPDSADNIRLIINLQRMAQAYGMTVTATKFDASSTQNTASTTPAALAAGGGSDVAASMQDYGVFNLEITTSGTYDNFLKFLKDVESSLRLTDIESITFTSEQGAGSTVSGTPAGYTYTINLRTYWLKPPQQS